jgi:hypothetical protein
VRGSLSPCSMGMISNDAILLLLLWLKATNTTLKVAWKYMMWTGSVITTAHMYGYITTSLYMKFILVPGCRYRSLVAK